MNIKLLIADDHEMVRSGLRSLLAGTDVSLVGAAATGDEALELFRKHKPEVVLLDIRMAETDGLAVLERIKREQPETAVLILSTYDNPTYVARAVSLGAGGYLLKGCSRDDLLNAIRKAAAGESSWNREELRRATTVMNSTRDEKELEASLTPREAEVLRQLAFGLTNKEIAETLHISYETVKEHVQHVLRKIGVTDRTQAAVWAVRKGLV